MYIITSPDLKASAEGQGFAPQDQGMLKSGRSYAGKATIAVETADY